MSKEHTIFEIWVYLSGSPLFALFLTLTAYQIGLTIYRHFKQNPLANPVAIAIILVACTIQLIDMPYSTYFEGAIYSLSIRLCHSFFSHSNLSRFEQFKRQVFAIARCSGHWRTDVHF